MKKSDWQKILRAMGLLTQIGIVMIVNIGIGFFLGYLLDNLINTGILFKITGLLLGIGSGFYSDYQLIKKMFDDNDDSNQQNN